MSLTAQWVEGEDWPDDAAVIQGGDASCPSWEDYAASWLNPEVPKALRDATPRDKDAQGLAEGWFRLSDGSAITMTYRACGDLLQAIADNRQGYYDYAYSGWTLERGRVTP